MSNSRSVRHTLLSLKPNEGRMSALMIGIMIACAMGAALGGTFFEEIIR